MTTPYLTTRELWLMAMAWNQALFERTLVDRPQMKDWLNQCAEDDLSVRQALAKNAPLRRE
jgi:hypothetical protein